MQLLGIVGFYGVILVFLGFSARDKEKTKTALRESWHSFKKLFPLILALILIITILEGVLNTETIAQHIDKLSGLTGLIGAAIIGAIIHIPPFAAFPIGGQLLASGVNQGVIATLINALIMVHSTTIFIEAKELGWKFSILRNSISLVGAILIGAIIGVLL